jgi:hypothetical protein
MIRLGQSKSRVAFVIVVEQRVYVDASAWNKNDDRRWRILGLKRNQREDPRLCARVYEEDLFVPVDETCMCNGYPRL